MSVAPQIPYGSSTGNGLSTVFPYNFLILQAADLAVYVDGNLKALNVDYTVDGVGQETGGNVTFLTPAPASLTKVTRVRQMIKQRTTDYQQQGDFLSGTVNPDFDRAILLAQELDAADARAIRVAPYEQDSNLLLPPKATRKNQILGFDNNGDTTMVGGLPSVPLSGPVIGGYIWPQTTAESNAGVPPTSFLFPPADVRRYGADPLGAIECSAAFVAAWTAYKNIYAPAGNYLVNPINLPGTQYQRTLYGDGPGRTILTANGQDHVVLLSNASVTQHSVTVRDLGIQGPNTSIALAFTAVVNAAATSATLTTPWALSTSSWNVTFSDGEIRRVTLTKGATTATWSGGLGGNCTANATTGGSGIHIPINVGFPIANFRAADVTINGMGGPGICDHNGCFTSQYERVQVNNCLDHLFDLLGGNTLTMIGCYAQGVPTAGKCGYRIHGARPSMIGCNGINTAGVLGQAQYGAIFSDVVGEDGRSSFCVPTLEGCNIEDAIVIGIRNKNGGCIFINTTILAPAANFAVTFNAVFAGGETSGTLSAVWAHLGGTYYVAFSNGDVRLVSLVNGGTSATWGTALSGAATANAATNTVDLCVDLVNEPGMCNNTNVLLQTKGATLANGTGAHTRSNNSPWYWVGNQVAQSTTYYDDIGQQLYTFGAMTKAVALAVARNGLAFGDSVFKDAIKVVQRAETRAIVAYSASMTPDASLGNIHEITATNGVAFTINAPANPLTDQPITIRIKNASGGALGAVTFAAAFHLAGAWASPATGNNRAVTFDYNGAAYYERNRSAADVAN